MELKILHNVQDLPMNRILNLFNKETRTYFMCVGYVFEWGFQ